MDCAYVRTGTSGGPSQHGTGPSGSINGMEFSGYLVYCQLLKECIERARKVTKVKDKVEFDVTV